MITFVAVFKTAKGGIFRQYWYESSDPQQADVFRVQHQNAMNAGQAIITVPVERIGENPLEELLT